MAATRPTDGAYAGANLSGKTHTVMPGDKSRSVDDGLDCRGQVGEIGGRT